LRRPSRW